LHILFHFANAVVGVDFSHLTASYLDSWSSCNQPSNFVNGYVSTVWFVVCYWPHFTFVGWALKYQFLFCSINTF